MIWICGDLTRPHTEDNIQEFFLDSRNDHRLNENNDLEAWPKYICMQKNTNNTNNTNKIFSDSTKTMIWIWKFGDTILALNERPYDGAASR